MSKGFLPLTRYAINIITDMHFNNDFCRVNKTLKIGIFPMPIRFYIKMSFYHLQCNKFFCHICLIVMNLISMHQP